MLKTKKSKFLACIIGACLLMVSTGIVAFAFNKVDDEIIMDNVTYKITSPQNGNGYASDDYEHAIHGGGVIVGTAKVEDVDTSASGNIAIISNPENLCQSTLDANGHPLNAWFSVTSIDAAAFNGCTQITAITIPTTVTDISDIQFNNCEDLQTITHGTDVYKRVDSTGGLGNNSTYSFKKPVPATSATTTVETSATTASTTYAEVNTNKKTTTTTAVTTTAETKSEPKIGGTSGWTKLEEKILQADSGDEIYIDMNGTTTVPQSIMSDIMGKDVDVTFDMGTYSWTINGKDITNPQNVNLGLTYTPNVIDSDKVSVLADGKPIMQFQLDYNGSFGFVGTCTLQLPSDKAGQYANLYYYNPETGKLEFQTCGVIGSNGYVELDFSHASDYVIVVDKTAMGTISAGAVSEDNAEPVNANGMMYIVIAMVIISGGIAVKKKIKR